jgi:hypothetical protein
MTAPSSVLSSAIQALPAERRAQASTGLDALPDEIGLPDMPELVPVMRPLEAGRQLNFLTSGAVALALCSKPGSGSPRVRRSSTTTAERFASNSKSSNSDLRS